MGRSCIFPRRNHPCYERTTVAGEDSNLQKITNYYINLFQNSNAPLPSYNLFSNIKPD
jgi:hypothetical protein